MEAAPKEAIRPRSGTEYWLNVKQALLICVLSDTPKAKDIQQMMVNVFHAALEGRLSADNKQWLL